MDDAIVNELQRISRTYDPDGGALASELANVVAMLEELPAKGLEAEELRAGIERVVDTYFDSDEVAEVVTDLQTLLSAVDARDSLAFVEAEAHLRGLRMKELNEYLVVEAATAAQELSALTVDLVRRDNPPDVAAARVRTLQSHLTTIAAGLVAVEKKV